MLTRRHFISAAVIAGSVGAFTGLNSVVAAADPTNEPRSGLRTYIGAGPVDRMQVLEWERKRLSVASARLRHDFAGVLGGELDSLLARSAAATDDISAARRSLTQARSALADDDIRELLTVELASSEAATRAALAASAGRWVSSTVEIVSDRGSANGFVDWFTRARTSNERAVWIDACPDHYVIDTLDDGRQEVIEVTGGAVLASRFFVDYTDSAETIVPADPTYSLAVSGVASVLDGRVIGGVCHQFRDEAGGGFRSQLKVGFPAAVPALYIDQHRWHLACEFGNWITAYLSAAVPSQ